MASSRSTASTVRESRSSPATNKAGDTEKHRSFLHRLAWFVGIWAASVAFLGLIAALIRLAL